MVDSQSEIPCVLPPIPVPGGDAKAYLSALRLVRCLDAIHLLLLLTAVLGLQWLIYRNAGWSQLRYVFVPQILGLCIATLCLPANLPVRCCAGASLFQLKTAALVTAGLCPFVPWWLYASASTYLTLAGSAAVLAILWYLQQLAAYYAGVFGYYRRQVLRQLAVTAYHLVFYAALVPASVVFGLFVWACAGVNPLSSEDLPQFWARLPPWLYAIMALPLISILLLAGYARQAPVYYLRQLAIKPPLEPPAHEPEENPADRCS